MKTKILIIDDETAITHMIKLNLERTGLYEVQEENEGKRALESALKFMPDLILLDVMMPDMSGDEVATLLKQNEKLKNTVLVFLTAIVTRDETANGHHKIGGNLFIAKPVKTEDLLCIISKLLKAED